MVQEKRRPFACYGLIKPTAGTIRICGYDLRKITKAMQYLGCIVENPELYPYLCGWDNLASFCEDA